MIRKPRDNSSNAGSSVVARRTLKRADGKLINVVIHAPAQEAWTPEEWACPISIRIGRQPARVVLTGRGVDSLQALLTALGALRGALAKEADNLVWLGERGALGIPVVVLDDDSDFLTVVEALVEAEYARRTFNLKRARKLLSGKAKR